MLSLSGCRSSLSLSARAAPRRCLAARPRQQILLRPFPPKQPPPPSPPKQSREVPRWVKVGGIAVPVVGGAVYLSNQDEAPYTHRRRFIIVSEARTREYGAATFQQIKEQYAGRILPDSHPAARTVRRVGRAVAAASGNIGRSFEWDFLVIRDDQTNAFVLPGGKVCVFTGLFKVCPTEDALAAVLAHEVGHAVANHFGEKLSKAFVVNLLLLGLVLMGFQYDHLARMVTNLILELPNSRKLESEADFIGLHITAKACYDPAAMPRVFERMSQVNGNHGGRAWEFMSTHPSDETRIAQQRAWLPEAEAVYESSSCPAAIRDGLWARSP